LPDLLASWKQELDKLNAAADLAGLEAAQTAAFDAYMREAKLLSKARAKVARNWRKPLHKPCRVWACKRPVRSNAAKSAQPMQSGLEEVAFLVAGHAGSSPRPVNKVASGGELSRIALAIAVTPASSEPRRR